MKFIVSRRLNSGERGDCPDTLAPSPPSLANRSFCRMVGGVSRRISEASDIRVTIRIAGEFGVDGDKAWHRIECVYVCVCVCFPCSPRFLPVRSHRGDPPPLSFRNGQFAQPLRSSWSNERIWIYMCVCMRETNTWSGVEWKQIGCASTGRQTRRKHSSGRFGIGRIYEAASARRDCWLNHFARGRRGWWRLRLFELW